MNEAWTLPALAWTLSAVLTASAIGYARRRQLLDQPGQRRSHSRPTPRGGGIGPVLALLLVWAFDRGGVSWSSGMLGRLPWITIGGLAAIAAIGWWDDHRPLSPQTRIVIHAVGALMIVLGVQHLTPVGTVEGLLIALALVAVVAAVNVCNFMDGINGMAASQAALCGAAVAMAAWGQPDGAGLALSFSSALAACSLGFLPFNFPQARVFLGDVGSGFLGASVALVLLLAWTEQVAHWALLAVLPSAFALDAGLTLTSRIFARRRWYRAHREHLYQWLVRSGMTHTQVTLLYAMWTAAMACLLIVKPAQPIVWAGAVYACGALLWSFGKRACLARARAGVSA